MNVSTPENPPLVTVYLTTHNRAELLERAVQSLREQSYINLEIIVVNDHSTDNTQDFLNDISKQDSRIIPIVNTKNMGAAASRNIAINLAQGEFITGLDDDDYFLPNRIQDFLTYWKENKKEETVLLFSRYFWKHQNQPLKKSRNTGVILHKKTITSTDILFRNYIGNQIFTETTMLKSILFDENLPAWEDLECWYRLLEQGCAEDIGKYNYVIDVSHGLQRISEFKLSKFVDSYQKIYTKHNLKGFEKDFLSSHLFVVHYSTIERRTLLKKLLYRPNFSDLKLLIRSFSFSF